MVRAVGNCRNAEEALMAIVAGFDVHRGQITFDALDTETGEVIRGRIRRGAGGRARLGEAVRRPRRACRGGGLHRVAVRR
jgi:hypothetical protein